MQIEDTQLGCMHIYSHQLIIIIIITLYVYCGFVISFYNCKEKGAQLLFFFNPKTSKKYTFCMLSSFNRTS